MEKEENCGKCRFFMAPLEDDHSYTLAGDRPVRFGVDRRRILQAFLARGFFPFRAFPTRRGADHVEI